MLRKLLNLICLVYMLRSTNQSRTHLRIEIQILAGCFNVCEARTVTDQQIDNTTPLYFLNASFQDFLHHLWMSGFNMTSCITIFIIYIHASNLLL